MSIKGTAIRFDRLHILQGIDANHRWSPFSLFVNIKQNIPLILNLRVNVDRKLHK